MNSPTPSVGTPARSALFTDFYELTMACGYWKSGLADTHAAFHIAFREPPFGSGYTLACGLAAAIDFLRDFHFTPDDLEYLTSIPGRDRQPLLDPAFLEFLARLRFTCDVDAVPEGTVVFAQEPLLRVQGPLIEAQLVETALLNFLNFESLIATKAARVCQAAQGEPVIEFGLRRAQGVDGGLTASRAAHIGGCAATSNVLAGRVFGIPLSGTHAHSWVLAFGDELTAFAAYAKALPNNCVFLVDTYDSLAGVRHAIEIGRRLREHGHPLAGIRLDSGDLAYLSIEARKLLDAAGFTETPIIGSNDLDEHLIASLKQQQGAAITVWGIGTHLITAYDQPALGGVYKLSAIRNPGGAWEHKLKLSEQAAKITNPGILQVRRFHSQTEFLGDAIYDLLLPAPTTFSIVHPLDPTRRKHFAPNAPADDLLVPIFRAGRLVYQPPSIEQIRDRVRGQLSLLHPGIRRLVNPHQYPAGLELSLHELKTRLVLQARGEVTVL
ncbi:MAG TPA: nicotinate phosphoribosyltransferase [Verrucomicrobiae bacterium]|nr:nicotinate phosphoribosyltransferase [Verrucomicrobiae bacterium]